LSKSFQELKHTQFFWLWSGETVSLAGSAVTFLALPLIAILTLDASVLEVSLLTVASSATPLFFALPAGVIGDRFNRLKISILSNFFRLVVLVIVILLMIIKELDIYVLYAASFLLSSIALFFDTAQAGVIQDIVPVRLLNQANAWVSASESTSLAAGPGLAGLVFQTLGSTSTLAVDAASYVFSLFCLSKLTLDSHSTETDSEVFATTFHQELAQGIRMLWSNKVRRPMVLAATIFNFFNGWIFAIYIVYAIRHLHFSPILLGLTFTLSGLAGLIAALLSTKFIETIGYGRIVIFSFMIIGPAGFLLPWANYLKMPWSFLAVAATFAITDFCIAINVIVGRTVTQLTVPRSHISRVSSVIRFVTWGVEPFGALIGGLVGSSFGILPSIFIATAGNCIPVFPVILSKRVRKFRAIPE
jgi:MFS family permease